MPNHRVAAGPHDKNCFDLLRLVFAALVLLSHSYELVDGNRGRELLTRLFHTISFGELGVDCFFILSGFLITMSWESAPYAMVFLRKRILRIYPGFAMAFLISVFIVGAIGAPDAVRYLRALHVASQAKDLLMLRVPVTPPAFLGANYQFVNGVLWTIQYEFMCYLLILGLGLGGALRGKSPVVLLWAVSLVVFLLFRFSERQVAFTGAIAGGIWVTLMRFVPLFLAGAVMFKTGWYTRRPVWLIALAVAVLIAGLCNKVTAEAALASAGAYLLLMFGSAVAKPRSLTKMPDISYGVYLYGWPSQKLVIFAGVGTALAVFGLSLAMAVCLAWFSWKFVEAPALRLNNAKVSWAGTGRWIASLRAK